MWGSAKNRSITLRLLIVCAAFQGADCHPTSSDHKLFNSITQVGVTREREPSSGGIRTGKSETDIRTIIESPDHREIIISLWSPRLHPFKEPPTYRVNRTCRYGEILESTIGVIDTSKTHILRKTGKDSKVPNAFEWNDTQLSLTEIQPPQSLPFKFENKGKVFEFVKTGSCQYFPAPMDPSESPKIYFYKHLEIGRLMNATDIIFPKTTFNFISEKKSDIGMNYSLPLSGYQDLVVDFGGSTFLLPANSGGFIFTNSHRISLKNLSLEWAKPGDDKSPSYRGPSLHAFYSPKDNNNDLWFENISLKRVPGWAFFFDSTPGIYVANSRISQIPGDAVAAAREGAVKAINCQDIIVKNNNFENLGSDGISIHGQFAVIMTQPHLSEKETPNSPLYSCVGLGSTWGAFAKDESLGFFTDALSFQGEAQLKKVKYFEFSASNTPTYCKGFAHCGEVCFVPHPEFSPEKGGYATSVTRNSSLFLLTGNQISNVAGKAISVQGANGEISENVISGAGGPGLQLSADLANQLQGPGAYNITVRNNEFQHVVQDKKFLEGEQAYFAGISIGATLKESDGRTVLVKAPLNQYIRIEGANSSIDQSGSVALLISSAKSIEVADLNIGAAGSFRELSSGSLSGTQAEGSVLLTRCQQVDLAGLTSPPVADKRTGRTRTIVIDTQNVTQFRIPISTRGRNGQSANTLWYTTFRGWFKENIGSSPSEVNLVIESPGLSTFHKKPPLEAFTILSPRVGDKEGSTLGKPLPLTATPSRWLSAGSSNWQSPNRIQLRPNFKGVYPDLFLSIDNATLGPKKQTIVPFES